jgi:hypothetical protein
MVVTLRIIVIKDAQYGKYMINLLIKKDVIGIGGSNIAK